MVGGRSCMIIFFPILGTIIALALSIIALLGSSPGASGLNSLYFMRVDFRNITTKSVEGLDASTSQAVDSIINNVIDKLGISDFYDAGASGYCEGNFKDQVVDIKKCSTPHTPYWFDLQTIIKDEINVGIDIKLPADVQNYENILKAASTAMWVCYVAGIVVLGIGFIVGFWAFRSRMASCCTTIISFIGFVLIFLASGLGTGIFATYTKYFNNAVSQYGIHASMDAKVYVITWIASGAALWAFVWWMFSICCTPSAAQPYPDFAEKQPFIGYVPRRQRYY